MSLLSASGMETGDWRLETGSSLCLEMALDRIRQSSGLLMSSIHQFHFTSSLLRLRCILLPTLSNTDRNGLAYDSPVIEHPAHNVVQRHLILLEYRCTLFSTTTPQVNNYVASRSSKLTQ